MTSTPDLLRVDGALHQPSWYRALTLPERIASLRAQTAEKAPVAVGNSEQAERRLRKWKSQPPFEQPTFFADRLALDGATEEDLCTLLSEPIEAVQARIAQPPEWLLTLMQAFASFDLPERFELLDAKQDQKLAALLHPITPLLKQGVERLLAGVEALVKQYPFLPFDKETIGPLLFSHVLDRLLPVLVKPLTLELNIARLQERLQGETPEERFHSFVQQLCEPGAMVALLELYPVLARLLVILMEQGVAYGLELLGHLCADWSEICEQLAPDHATDKLTGVQFGAGDTHRGGRSVVLLTFRSGFKLVYKPKSLAIDTHFQALLTWLKEQGEPLDLRAVRVLDKGDYGWSEYVPAQPCTSEEEVARFYERLGGYLALLYALEGTDLHHENLIACGEYPMLVDLETLFQPYPPLQTEDQESALPQGLSVLRTSVMRIGLLPQRIWATAEGDGIDVSGLGGAGGQLTPHPVAMLEAPGTDQMRFIRQRVAMEDRLNRPTLDGMAVDDFRYLDQVSAGFTKIYRLLMTHREALLTEILPLFAHDEIRCILRPTQSYAQLLQESMHPTLLRNALDRDRLFDHLWTQVPRIAFLPRIISSEVHDLREHTIPVFTTRPASRALSTSQGDCIADFFDESGLAAVEQRIQKLDEQDLARQLWLIQASFATKVLGQEQATWKTIRLLPTRRKASEKRLLQAACAVGDRLCDLAILGRSTNDASWMSLQLIGERVWTLSITDLDLYSGTAGIGLFLAYLGAITGKNRYTALARQVVESIRRQIQAGADLHRPGAFTGWGGLLYFYTHLAALWQDTALLTEAEGLIDRFADAIETDRFLDVLAGVAGGLRGLLTLYYVAPSSHILNAALRCGDHLLARATAMPKGVGWTTPMAPEQPLTGYSHGAAGIALSLLELAALSGDEGFKHTALAAMEYERSLFSPERQNWPDLRDEKVRGSSENRSMVAWCHGAPGIALARLGSLAYLDNATTREEIALALKTTRAQGFGLNHSLCHGDLGNLDVLLTASQILDDASYHAEVARLAAMLLDSIERQGWCTGVPLGVETPGLMTGIAGIGYELLRLAKPDQVPSVLLLAPPRLAH
jgi:type 2 lantibiotic biosynthesis protein LanM